MSLALNKTYFKEFASAFAAILAAVVITLFIPSLSDGGMYFLFLTAIIFSTLHGGAASGSFAVGVSIVFNFLLLYYLGKFPLKLGDWLVLTAFGLASGFTVFLCYAQMESEIARRLAESKYRMIFEDAITGIYETTLDGRYVAANPKLAMIFGYETPANLISEANLNTKFYVEVGRREEFIRLINENGQISGFESEIYRRDGKKIWITENSVAVRDKNGELTGFQGTSIDITDRKNAEAALKKAHEQLEEKIAERTADLELANAILRDENSERRRIESALRQSEEKFRTLVEVVSDCVWEADKKGIYTYLSPKIVEVVGYEPSELIGKSPYDLMTTKEDTQRVLDYLKPIVAARQNFIFMESVNGHKNGEEVTTETSGVPMFDDSGNYCGYRGIVRNITSRKRAEAAMYEIEQQLRTVVTAAPLVLFAVDRNGIFTLSEGNGLDALNLRAGEVVGQSVFELYRHSPEVTADISRALKGETFVNTVMINDLIFETRYSPILDEQENVLEIIGVSIDVTGQKRIENELLASQRQLRNLSAHLESVREEERKYIARELHDELGQTLTALKIDLTKLNERLPNLQTETVRKQITGRVPAMIEIVDTAMETTQKIVAQLRPAVLDELGLTDAAEWQMREFQKLTGIKCEIDINLTDKNLPLNLKTAIFRILQECLTNITRHAAATKVKIELKNEDATLFFTIEDNGRGMGKQKMATTKSFGISGMRERTLLLGGTLEITRPENGGTQVMVRIPC
jgi:PAS domain S-box-containing protein